MNDELKNSEAYITKKIGKNNGFKTPLAYFDALEFQISKKVLKGNKNNYTIPNNYFETLEDTILSKVSSSKKETKKNAIRSLTTRFTPIAAAASILLFIGINYFTFNSSENITFDAISDADIENWLIDNTNNVSINDITFATDGQNTTNNEITLNTINENDLEEYLISIETTSLLNEINE